jgi:hypothetical protein
MTIAATIRDLEQAFISPNMILMDDEWIDAVVTARRSQSRLWLKIRPVEPPAALASLSIFIDERDLGEVQKLLGEERQVLPMALEDDLATAMRALREIAEYDDLKISEVASWKGIAMAVLDIAQKALAKIADTEADNGTPSDSS